MRIIHRICHYLLYAFLIILKFAKLRWQMFTERLIDTVYHLAYRTDQ